MRGIPDEDLGPGWLRGYESIQADLQGMRAFAAALHAELEKNYTPHRAQVNRDMVVEGSRPDERFRELCHLLERHWFSRAMTTALLTEHGNATWTFATTARAVSDRHGDADGMAKARSEDILRYMDTSGGTRSIGGEPAPGGA